MSWKRAKQTISPMPGVEFEVEPRPPRPEFKNMLSLLETAEEFDHKGEDNLCNKQLLLLSDYIQECVKNNHPKE